MTLGIIFNPTAGRGRAGRQRARLEDGLRRRGVPFRLWETPAPATGAGLALRAAAQCDAVIAAGGDGTVHEVSAGLLEGGGNRPLGVLPLGTGNDFARAVGMPPGLEEALDALLAARPACIDHGRLEADTPLGRLNRTFVNGVGIGLDAEVAARAMQHKRLPGVLSYLVAALRAVPRWEAPVVEVTLEPGEDDEQRWSGPLLLLAVGNGPSAGGGFRLTPAACLADGRLDVCRVQAMPLRRVWPLIPAALRGQHGRAPEVALERVRELHIRTMRPVPVHLDGELLTRAAHTVRLHVQPGGLRLLRPGYDSK
ncbi:hypothetical protein AWN76_005800 [Rhodothermaceae bacterium RA]|nr:hypothetical protein AWN76_005800 [Rhodothermaceae bacterium RA]